MSHQPERKEKDCLNCGTTVLGRFCHVCGQENIITKESFWTLTKHFVYDIFHFDGNFFATVKYLFIRPGFVAKEYTRGKRVKYLHPIRMYLFTSAVFFLFFVNFSNSAFTNSIKTGSDTLSSETRKGLAETLEQQLQKNPQDTALKTSIRTLLDTSRQMRADEFNGADLFTDQRRRLRDVRTYDSSQLALAPKQRDGWITRRLYRKGIEVNQKFRENRTEATRELSESFLHKAPYMLFISLPFFALLLKLLYVRRKNFYYSDHAIFTLYHYIFTFIALLLVLSIKGLETLSHWAWLSSLVTFIFFAWLIYSYLEMRNFYQQGYLKTVVKFLLLNFLAFITILILFVGFLLIVFLQM